MSFIKWLIDVERNKNNIETHDAAVEELFKEKLPSDANLILITHSQAPKRPHCKDHIS